MPKRHQYFCDDCEWFGYNTFKGPVEVCGKCGSEKIIPSDASIARLLRQQKREDKKRALERIEWERAHPPRRS
jgi:hypothetical protein